MWTRWILWWGPPPSLCGPSSATTNAMNAQANAANQLSSVASTAEQNQQQQYAQSQALEAPLVAQETALASGNRTAAVNAAMPTISTLSQGYNAALSQIQDTLPPGAARDQAVAQLQRQEYTGIAGAQASAVQQAPQVLAQLGAGDAGLSVQELGAALSGYTSSANAQGQVAAEGNAQKANQLSFFGQLAGAAGSAASGFNLGGSSQDASTSAANADNSVPFQVAWT